MSPSVSSDNLSSNSIRASLLLTPSPPKKEEGVVHSDPLRVLLYRRVEPDLFATLFAP
jgi:hypothetical protein